MIKLILLFLYFLHTSYQWNYNPYCWINNCYKSESEQKSFFHKYNPYCLVAECGENKNSLFWNPKCWFSDCIGEETYWLWSKLNIFSNENKQREDNSDNIYHIYNPLTWYQKIFEKKYSGSSFCWLRTCENEKSKPPTVLESIQKTLNRVKPKQIMTKLINSFEVSPHCWFIECCIKEYIPGNIDSLKYFLRRIHGQPFIDIIINAIETHWNSYSSNKALVLSLHGYIGTGKTYVLNAIVNSLYKLGYKSSFVHQFIGSLFFEDEIESKKNLYNWIKGNLTNCDKQLFVFDQLDQIPEDILNYIKPLMINKIVAQVDYSKAIFIFISNIGSKSILEKFIELRNNNIEREKMTLNQYSTLISDEAFKQPGGLFHSDIINENVIDHIIPFLPLELEHISQCILQEFRDQNIDNPLLYHITEISNSLEWKNVEDYTFSLHGCSKIPAKVAFFIQKYYRIGNEEL